MFDHAYKELERRSLLDIPMTEFRLVVNEHQATRHHFDVNLKIGDLYLTWFINDSLSKSAGAEMCAEESGVHGLACESAERYIAAGKKGSGPKMVWDASNYLCHLFTPRGLLDCLDAGELRFVLDGGKLQGAWILRRRSGKQWSFIKEDDEFATSDNLMQMDRSPISGFRLRDFDIGPVAWVEIEGFYAAQHAKDKPTIVLKNGSVIDPNQLAIQRKIEIGMTERQARTILPDGDFITWNKTDYLEKQNRWLDICVKFTDSIEPVQQHTAFLDLSLHPDPLAIAQELETTLSKAMSARVRIGVAKAKWVAQLAIGSKASKQAFENPRTFLSDLPVAMLTPVQADHRSRLEFLGYSTIGEVNTIPFPELIDQFDEQAHTIQQAARGSFCQRVEAKYPGESLLDRFVFDGAVESTEVIRDACDHWSKKIGERLQAKSLAGSKIWLALESEHGDIKILTRTFNKSIACTRTVLSALLQTLGRVEKPLVSMKLQLSELHRYSVHQPSLFGCLKDGQRMVPAIQKVKGRFGDHAIALGNERPEERRVRVLRAWKNATGWY